MIKIKFSFYIIFILFLVSGCSDSIVESVSSIDENNEIMDITPIFTNIQNEIFDQSCALSGCHVSGGVSPDLSGNSYNNIVNRISSTGVNYITPNDPDNSYLLLKMIGSNGISGSRMPLNASPIPQNQIDTVIEWINDGAPDN